MNDLIEIKELRIGNLLSYDNQIVHVTSISLDIDDEYEDQIGFCSLGKMSNEKGGWNRSLVDKLAPVTLTPTLLDRFGFSQFADGSYHRPEMLTWRILYDSYEKAASYCTAVYPELGHRIHINIRIEYLHQLQNVFYTMTGSELPITDFK